MNKIFRYFLPWAFRRMAAVIARYNQAYRNCLREETGTGYLTVGEIKTTKCKALVAGLDEVAFLDALDQFLEKSREDLFNIMANPNTDISK